MIANAEWLGPDAGRREAFQRALNVAGAGNVLLQTYINRTVQQLVLRELGVSAALNRKPGSGNAAYINRRTPGAAASWVADTTSLTEVTGTYAQASFAYKTLATRGKVTRKLQATGRSYGDVLAGEISGRAGDFADTYETGLVTGDIAVDANQFDGLITLIQGTSSQIVLQTTTTTGDQLTLDKLDEAIDVVKGAGNRQDLVIFASFKGRRLLNTALQAQQQFVNETEIGAGFRVMTYNTIPIVTSTSIPDVLTFNGSKVTAYSGSTTTAIIIVNKQYCWIEELTPTTVMPLAKTDSQFDQFDIFSDSALAYGNTRGASILCGIAAA